MAQTALLTTVMLLPFLSLNGNPFLRMDIGQRTLFLAGVTVRIDQFYLVLLTSLVIVIGFLLMTVILGRVWCGWFCPQTILNDLTELFRKKLQKFAPDAVANALVHLFVLILSAVVSINLLSWFMAPSLVIQDIAAFRDHPVVFFCCATMTISTYLNLILVKRSFCRSYCPYGRFQAALLDDGTLTLAFLEETRDRCIRCGSCVRVCPLGIDIRDGFQIECINCGRCIDACRGVMERRDQSDGLIAYRFGSIVGNRPRIGTKTLILATVLCVLSSALIWGVYDRSDTAFSVQRVATADTRTLSDGSTVQAWRATIGNRSQTESVFEIAMASDPAMKIQLLGQVHSIRIPPNENQQVGFFIQNFKPVSSGQQIQLQLLRDGTPVSSLQIKP